MRYFDSHAHYYDARFSEEVTGGADALLPRLLEDSVSGIVNVGTSPETSRLAAEQAKKYPAMVTALGIHPTDCQGLSVPLDDALAQIEGMIRDPRNKCVMIGEIGLDYHYDDTDREKQLRYFHAQLELAETLGLPVSIHDRDAHGDTLSVLLSHPNVRGILHSFSGSADMARDLVKLGYMISFSGVLTFTNARKTKEVAATVPRDRLLIETDCPYLAPHPLRGTCNHSGNLCYTNAALAAVIGIGEEECAALTEANAKRFLGLN